MLENGGLSQADLRWVLPFKRGETAWIYGVAPALEESLTAAGVNVHRLESLRVVPSEADYLLAPNLGAKEAETLIGLGKQAVRPGGYVLLGLRNAAFLEVLIGKSSPDRVRLSTIFRHMRMAEFLLRSTFGVFYSLDEPRFLISLETRSPSRYFWGRLYLPPSRLDFWKRCLAILLTDLGLQMCLYSAFVLTAQRRRAEC
jgi:hypothetical protein